MDITEEEFEKASARTERVRRHGHVHSARYDRRRKRVIALLHSGIEVTFPVQYLQDLAGASDEDLAEIRISPTGLGLHWPRLDADFYVPSLLRGVFGNRKWMASEMGTAGGKARSAAKAAAARANGRKGGRPRRASSRNETRGHEADSPQE